MTMLSWSGSWADAISLPVVTGGMPNSRSATSNASWLFSTASSSFRESKLLENQNNAKFRDRRQRCEKLNQLTRKEHCGQHSAGSRRVGRGEGAATPVPAPNHPSPLLPSPPHCPPPTTAQGGSSSLGVGTKSDLGHDNVIAAWAETMGK